MVKLQYRYGYCIVMIVAHLISGALCGGREGNVSREELLTFCSAIKAKRRKDGGGQSMAEENAGQRT